MEDHYFVEQCIDIAFLLLFSQRNRVLSVEVDHHITGVIAFPIDLNGQIVISRIKVNLNSSITIAVDKITDIGTKLIN